MHALHSQIRSDGSHNQWVLGAPVATRCPTTDPLGVGEVQKSAFFVVIARVSAAALIRGLGAHRSGVGKAACMSYPHPLDGF